MSHITLLDLIDFLISARAGKAMYQNAIWKSIHVCEDFCPDCNQEVAKVLSVSEFPLELSKSVLEYCEYYFAKLYCLPKF